MAKSSGKKRHRGDSHNVNLLCNVSGLQEDQVNESMDDCLAQFEGAQGETDQVRAINKRPAMAQARYYHSNTDESWIRSFQNWVMTGNYVDGLPNPQVEVSRHFQTQELSSFLLRQCPSLRMPAFERWWIDSKWEEYPNVTEPVIPCRPSLETEASQRLVEEIVHGNDEVAAMTEEQAKRIVHDLCSKTQHAYQEVSTMSLQRLKPLGKGAHIELEKGATQHTLRFKRKSWKKAFVVHVNVMHYDRLWHAFIRIHSSLSREKRVIQSFHVLVFCLLLRYSSLSGGHLLNDLRGGGMQGAVHSQVFDVLKQFFPSQNIMECFASSWNAHLPMYTSAFCDLDSHFGAYGDFRSYPFQEGVYEANPPFSPGVMMHMVERMRNALAEANHEERQLTFFVVVPTTDVGDAKASPAKRHAEKSFTNLTRSVYCRLHLVLPARQHGYVEGAQHLRPTQYKQSSYRTSLILLQSDAAHKGMLDYRRFENIVRKAFASRHEDEIQQRQQRQDSS